ncbi:MAG: hypothetical protein KatS3mg114_0420 [Planctomycetaceae bacterium]|nr:MAG: hypothetical protein KatS3mg114_0420 [Planctomycetaceae bacterium]
MADMRREDALGSDERLVHVIRQLTLELERWQAYVVSRHTDSLFDQVKLLQELTHELQQLTERYGALKRTGSALSHLTSRRSDPHAAGRTQQSRDELCHLMQQLRLVAWSTWITTQRSYAFMNDLLELLAHGGQLPPDYHPTTLEGTGGSLLNYAA